MTCCGGDSRSLPMNLPSESSSGLRAGGTNLGSRAMAACAAASLALHASGYSPSCRAFLTSGQSASAHSPHVLSSVRSPSASSRGPVQRALALRDRVLEQSPSTLAADMVSSAVVMSVVAAGWSLRQSRSTGYGSGCASRRRRRERCSFQVTCRRGVAPWLQEPANLEEAYGLPRENRPHRTRAERREERPAWQAPAMQQPLKERLANVKVYKDIVEQVESQHHGAGGFRRRERAMKRTPKENEKKPRGLTPADKLANTFGMSSCTRHASATLGAWDKHPKPETKYPEVAFAGRSNVGKSSLLNKVSAFGTVAAVSSMPGRTKHVTWYRNRKCEIDVIDMPGYGHSDRARLFGPAAMEFVTKRTSLQVLYVLIDARSGFLQSDYEWLAELGKDGPMKQIILTKCDMVPAKKLVRMASLVRADLELFRNTEHKLLLSSAAWATGMHEVRMDILRRTGKLGSSKLLADL
eukprot:TRINITY_DN8630_c0_g4_i1.p1 TRINITY_DN8630_c0_g4~~TRINITY_DN8630_c0_g4_i1.p1  ORF type:complete len:491 (+),score=76.10 TRINITY_DN8630_c0_g4_i1:75-1475(+)